MRHIIRKISYLKPKRSLLAVLLLFLVVPALAIGSHRHKIYVDHDNKGEQNGSSAHPYKTISQAIKKADENTDIIVAKGEYEENITLKKNIRLYGKDKDDTVIKADKDKWATVTMDDNSRIDNFTIRGGGRGIWVEKDAKVSIIDCIIKYNDKDGIGIEGGNTKKANEVSISNTEIRKNGHNGIVSFGPRRVVVTDSEILDNDNDGLDLARGTSAWIAGNTLKNNGGSGMKLVIDGSSIWTKNNSYRENRREGLEISFFGGSGRINIAKSKFVANGLHGIAKVQRAIFGNSISLWNKGLTLENNNEFWDNVQGGISGIYIIR